MTTQAVSGLAGGLYIGDKKVAECDNLTLTWDMNTQDATNADGGGWEEFVAGTRNWQISGGFNLVVGDANGFQALQNGLFEPGSIEVRAKSTDAGPSWSGKVLVTQGQFNLFDLRNPQKVRWTLKGTGPLVVTH